jgi:hypothetical protein
MGAFISGGRNLADGTGGWREVEELCPTPGTWPVGQGYYSPRELRRSAATFAQIIQGVVVVVDHYSLGFVYLWWWIRTIHSLSNK